MTDEQFRWFAQTIYTICRGERNTGSKEFCSQVDFLIVFDYFLGPLDGPTFDELWDQMLPKVYDLAPTQEARQSLEDRALEWRQQRTNDATRWTPFLLKRFRMRVWSMCNEFKDKKK